MPTTITGDCRTEGPTVLGRLVAAYAAGATIIDGTSGPGVCTVNDSGNVWGDGDGTQHQPRVTCGKPHGLGVGDPHHVTFVNMTGGLYEDRAYEVDADGETTFLVLGAWIGDAAGGWR